MCTVYKVIVLTIANVLFAADPSRIRIHKGWVTGNKHIVFGNVTVHEYLGIPMAKAPVGSKRFTRPEPVDPWRADWNANKKPNACYGVLDTKFESFYGSDMWNPKEPMSEDCLYINAWIPNPDNLSYKKPIMVWIYGGGFYSGSSSLDVYDGRYLAASQNIIVISMQYRLGILGFLNLGNIAAPGNMGLLDQLLGLKWVQENAEYINGDKNNVTLFGESAGAVSVGLHLISPLSRNLFNRAILQSGSPTADWSFMTQESSWKRLRSTMGSCTRTSSVPGIVNCLRNMSAKELVDSSWAPAGLVQFSWLPSVDNYFLLEDPEVSLRLNKFKRCPIMIGTNSNEGSWFIPYEFQNFTSYYNKDNINFTIPHVTHKANLLAAFKFYPQWDIPNNEFGSDAIAYRYSDWQNPDNTSSNVKNLDMAIGDYHFVCPVGKLAQYYTKAYVPVYSYVFSQRSSRSQWGRWMGVLHGDEIMFVFGEPLKPNSLYTDEEKLLSRHMMELWAKFAKTGVPRSTGSQAWSWPQASLSSRKYYELNAESLKSPIVGVGPRLEYCAFWDMYIPQLVRKTKEQQKEC